jgi:tetratricopeptide (TPR) repeat protein
MKRRHGKLRAILFLVAAPARWRSTVTVAIDREKVLATAQKYVEKKRYDRAAIEYQKILQEDPGDARTLLKLGDLQSKMEAYAEAVSTYERVGRFYASQGFSLKAIAVYKQIREIIGRHVPELDAKYLHVVPMLAELYEQLGLTSDALGALDEVATRLQREGRDGEALEVFRKIVELDTTNPLAHLRLAEALARTQQNNEAALEFGTASGQLLRQGRRDDALRVIERLLQFQADPSHARIAAELYLARNGPTDAMQALAKLQVCFQANRHDLDTLDLLARAFTQIGQAAKAVEVQKEMARIARETRRADIFHELVTKLLKLAPNDDGVKQLAATGMADAPSAPSSANRAVAPPLAGGPLRDEAGEETQLEEAYEDVGDGDIEEEAQPIDLARAPVRSSAEDDVLVESSVDVVDETLARAGVDESPRTVARTLADAAACRRDRRLSDAVRVLRAGVAATPKSLELHELLRDILLEAGDTAAAVAEIIHIAELLVEALDGEEAARALQDALALEPENAVASRMLRDLGYELVEEEFDESVPVAGPAPSPRAALASGYDPEGPLPAYDLDEVGTEDVVVSHPRVSAPQLSGPRAPIDAMDDPFEDAPLPSFPLDGASEPADAARAVGVGRPGSGAPKGIPELESALEEADFFASRGLFDDARTILQEQLARLPNHPLLRDRLEELQQQEQSAHGDSGTRRAPAPSVAPDRAFDIAASLTALDELDRPNITGPTARFNAPTEQIDVEEVFAKFKAGVAAQIAIDDTQSHYDLGVAYREMGLVEDAIREFQLAARDPKRACICHSMIGMIELERGNVNDAIEAFQRGLHAPERTKDQEAALCYELGAAYEAKKVTALALDSFQRTARLVPSYRDVQERIRRLQRTETKQPPRAVAVGADDEFDRAFSDMVGDEP